MDSGRDNFKDLIVRSAVVAAVFGLLVGLLGVGLHVVLDERILEFSMNILITIALFWTAFVIVYAAGYTFSVLEEAELFTPHHKEIAYRFLQLLTFSGILFIITIYVWDISISNVLLGAGVTSVILALAARQTLSSVLSGIIIISTDIFRVGDWVKIDDRFGRITRISLFNTEVSSPQGEKHVFPNDDLTARDITNLGDNRYRNDVLVGVDYGTDIEHATAVCDAILEELTADEGNDIDGFHPTTVKDFDESQITLAVKMWVDKPTPRAINQAQTTVFSRIHRQFADEGIEIPFPQRTVSEREQPDPTRC